MKKAHLPPWVPVQGDYSHVVVEGLLLRLVQVVAGEVSDLAGGGGGVTAFQGYIDYIVTVLNFTFVFVSNYDTVVSLTFGHVQFRSET